MACDTIVREKPPKPSYNWIGVANSKETSDYLITEVVNNQVAGYFNKKDKKYIYKNSSIYKKNINKFFDAFIGLAGINDYESFWKGLSFDKTLSQNELQVTNGLNSLLVENKITKVKKFTWIDTGSDKNYSEARKYFKDNFLLKHDEFLYNEENKIIKFFIDKSKTLKRYNRTKFLKNTVPKVNISGENFLFYEYIPGKLLSDTNDSKIFNNFLKFLHTNLWTKRLKNKSRIRDLHNKSLKFYKDKTIKRVISYLQKNKNADKVKWINNQKTEPIKVLLNRINWENLSNGSFSYFHGDPQPENVIVQGKNKFKMIDWREDFGGSLDYGDVYYDLGKIYHSLIITGKKIREEKYFVSYDGEYGNYKFSKRRNLINYLDHFEKFIVENFYELNKVKLVSALIYLNIATMHHHPYSDLLFFHGKVTLDEILNSQ